MYALKTSSLIGYDVGPKGQQTSHNT